MATPKILGKNDNKPKILGLAETNNDNIPDKMNLPETEGFFSKLPRNILIGLTHLGRNIHNLPHDIVQGLERGTENISTPFNKLKGPKINKGPSISNLLPYDPNEYGDVFGQQGEGTLFDRLIQKGIEHAPEIAGGYALLRRLPITQGFAARPLKQAQNLARERGIESVNIHPELMNEARQFLNMRNPDVRQLYEEALEGGYEPLMSLQSDIGREARALRKSPVRAESRRAPQAASLKQRMLQGIQNELRTQGHDDIADLIGSGINKYRQFKQIEQHVYPILKKLGIPIGVGASIIFGGKKVKKFLTD